MKVSRFFQSCLLIEDKNTKILIDPSGQERDKIGDLGKIEAVLYTHEHADHFDADMAQTFVEQGIAPVYANASTAKLIKASKTVVKHGQELSVGQFKIKVIELPHCLMPDGRPGPQNVGYLINNRLFHPGDGKELANVSFEILAMPLNGPDISMKDALSFAKQVSAKDVIPIHYDYMGGNPEFFSTYAQKVGINTHVLKNGESVNL